jgi:hypothetical protein
MSHGVGQLRFVLAAVKDCDFVPTSNQASHYGRSYERCAANDQNTHKTLDSHAQKTAYPEVTIKGQPGCHDAL